MTAINLIHILPESRNSAIIEGNGAAALKLRSAHKELEAAAAAAGKGNVYEEDHRYAFGRDAECI